MAGSSNYRFGVLTKIVKHMRVRHLDGDDHPLTLEDILDETNQLDIGSSVKNVRGTAATPVPLRVRCFIDLSASCVLSVVANRSAAEQSEN